MADEPTPSEAAARHVRTLLDDARHHLEAARATADAGTEVPDDARLRQVKRAVNLGLRPVTSHQVPFNHELLLTVERLSAVVEALAAVVADGRAGASAVTDEKVAAAIATVEVGQGEVEDEVARLAEQVGALLARVEAAEAATAAQRATLGGARAREDVVLRAARDAVAPGGDPGAARAELAAAASAGDAVTLGRLRAAAEAPVEVASARAEVLAPVVVEAARGGRVLDLDPGLGRWLDAWTALGLDVQGVEADPTAAALLAERGHPVVQADPVAHLAGLAPASVAAVTAADLADRLALDALLALVDAALRALRPGGVVALALATPGTEHSSWIDPRRRPLHPEALVLLLLERGGVEAEVVDLDDEARAVVARAPGGPGRER